MLELVGNNLTPVAVQSLATQLTSTTVMALHSALFLPIVMALNPQLSYRDTVMFHSKF